MHSFGLETIHEETIKTPAHWVEDEDNQEPAYRATLSPRLQHPRFFPRDASEPRKPARMDWAYATKILNYEHSLEHYRQMCLEAQSRAETAQEKLKEAFKENRRLANSLYQSQIEAEALRARLDKTPPKKKIIKLKERHGCQSIQTSEALTARNRGTGLCQETECKIGTQHLLSRIKHLENQRKYEQERIQEATLALQLDLKMKSKQIQRLQGQLTIYQIKFQELLNCEMGKSEAPNKYLGFGKENMPHYHQRIKSSCKRSCASSRITGVTGKCTAADHNLGEQEKQTAKLMCEAQTATKRKHGRSGSSNLEEHPQRRREIKVMLKQQPSRCII